MELICIHLCVMFRLHLTRERMSFLPTSMGWQTPKCSLQHQTDPEEYVAAAQKNMLCGIKHWGCCTFSVWLTCYRHCMNYPQVVKWHLRNNVSDIIFKPCLFNTMILLWCFSQRTVRFCEQLATVIPNAHVYYRRGLALKRVVPQCIARNFTYVMVVNEDRKVPSILKPKLWATFI